MLPADCKVLAVFEDWAGDGAGNGTRAHASPATPIGHTLPAYGTDHHHTINANQHKPGFGTLYAYQNAVAKAAALYEGFDLHAALLDKTVSAALYHTAGKGTRCVPFMH